MWPLDRTVRWPNVRKLPRGPTDLFCQGSRSDCRLSSLPLLLQIQPISHILIPAADHLLQPPFPNLPTSLMDPTFLLLLTSFPIPTPNSLLSHSPKLQQSLSGNPQATSGRDAGRWLQISPLHSIPPSPKLYLLRSSTAEQLWSPLWHQLCPPTNSIGYSLGTHRPL